MDSFFLLNVLFRWMHVFTAIVIFGGTIFMRFVLMPAAAKISDEAHEQLRGYLMKTWKIFVHVGITTFVISGFYNYFMVSIPAHRGDTLYHALLGTKIILAFVVFFLASVLVGRASAFARMRQNRKFWLGVIILLSTIIVLISGFLKVRPFTPSPTVNENGQTAFVCPTSKWLTPLAQPDAGRRG